MKINAYLLIFFSLNLMHKAHAQEMQHITAQVFDLCYQLKLQSADSVLNNISFEMKQEDETMYYLLKTHLQWWKIISGLNNKQNQDNYYQCIGIAERLYQKGTQNNYEQWFKGISIYGYLARIDGLNKNYIKAFFNVRTCLKLLEKSFGYEAKYPFFYFTTGLYNCYMATASSDYPILAPYLRWYPSGNKLLGIAYLEKATNSENRYISNEAHYFLMKIFMDDQIYNKALQHAQILTDRYEKNAVFLYYQFCIYLKMNRIADANLKAQQLLQNLNSNSQINKVQVAHFNLLIQQELKNKKK